MIWSLDADWFFPVIRRPVIHDFGIPENIGFATATAIKTADCDAVSINNGLYSFIKIYSVPLTS